MNVEPLDPEARMWGQPGESYDSISFGLADTITHAVQVLWPCPGERILDIGTGTGWTARLAAWRNGLVTGVDIAPGMLEAAKRLSTGAARCPDFQQAAAEALPFPDETFDGVISTYGVIFSNAPSKAVAEMARVLRPGGHLALATWAEDPDGYIAGFFNLVGQWSDAPPPEASPFDWGRTYWLWDVVGARFEIEICEQTTTLYAPDVGTVWKEYVNGFWARRRDLCGPAARPERGV